jgi:hypothetical protein
MNLVGLLAEIEGEIPANGPLNLLSEIANSPEGCHTQNFGNLRRVIFANSFHFLYLLEDCHFSRFGNLDPKMANLDPGHTFTVRVRNTERTTFDADMKHGKYQKGG